MKHRTSPQPAYKLFIALAYVLGIAHLIFGASKLIGPDSLTKEFTEVWHFPLWFMYFVGVAQVLGGIGLIIKPARLPAALAMALVMIGAIVTTIISGQILNVIICVVVLLLCLITFVVRLKSLAVELAINKAIIREPCSKR